MPAGIISEEPFQAYSRLVEGLVPPKPFHPEVLHSEHLQPAIVQTLSDLDNELRDLEITMRAHGEQTTKYVANPVRKHEKAWSASRKKLWTACNQAQRHCLSTLHDLSQSADELPPTLALLRLKLEQDSEHLQSIATRIRSGLRELFQARGILSDPPSPTVATPTVAAPTTDDLFVSSKGVELGAFEVAMEQVPNIGNPFFDIGDLTDKRRLIDSLRGLNDAVEKRNASMSAHLGEGESACNTHLASMGQLLSHYDKAIHAVADFILEQPTDSQRETASREPTESSRLPPALDENARQALDTTLSALVNERAALARQMGGFISKVEDQRTLYGPPRSQVPERPSCMRKANRPDRAARRVHWVR